MLFRLLWRHLRPYARWIALIVVLQATQAIAALFLPSLNANLIDNGVLQADTGHIERVGLVMVAVAVIQITCSIASVCLSARTAMRVGRDLRATIFGRVQGFSAREVGRFGTASLVNRTSNDVQQVQLLALLMLTLMVAAPVTCVGAVIMASRLDRPLSGLLLVIAPVLIILMTVLIVRMRPLFRVMQTRLDRLNGILREQITGVRVIRAFVRDRREQARFGAASEELRDVSMRVGRLMVIMYPALMMVIYVSSVTVLWLGGHRIASGQMQVGVLSAFLSYLMQILTSILASTLMFGMLPRAEASAERIQEVLATESSIEPPARPLTGVSRRGRVELRSVEFGYPGAEIPVLHGVDLLAGPGETTALIGSSGSGKTTLLNLIARLFDATGGSVLVGGTDVRDLDPRLLSSCIGLVPQRPYLFSGTVASNLRYGRQHATDAELWTALDVAQARDFVERMPGGLRAPVTQGGSNLSGGQRQRLAIARALVRRPDIYLFDDSFAALDYATDAALRAALAREVASATVIVVAQRITTIRDAARIVVLDQGRVVGSGTHDTLMAGNAVYRDIVYSQLTEREAAITGGPRTEAPA